MLMQRMLLRAALAGLMLIPPTVSARAQTAADTTAVLDGFAAWVRANHETSMKVRNGAATVIEIDTAASMKAAIRPFLARYPQGATLHPEAQSRALFSIQSVRFDIDTATVSVDLLSYVRGDANPKKADYSKGTVLYLLVRRNGLWAPYIRTPLRMESGTFTEP